MADELNVPTHRWYEPRNNIALPPNAVSPKYILANGVAMIDAWINSQPWGMPLYLFAADEPGWLYDNSDMSTLFQDSVGITPVTDVGQPVGLQLDKSKGLVLGPELVTNGDFSAGSTGWTSSSWTFTGGVATYPDTINGFFRPAPGFEVPLVGGKSYIVTFNLVSSVAPASVSLTNVDGTTLYTPVTALSGNGPKQFVISPAASTTNIRIYAYASSGGPFSLDNISVKELVGTHRTQTTAASRPTFARLPVTGRRNTLLATETLATQSVTVTAAARTLSFYGTGTITLSGASTAGPLVGTGSSNRVSLTFTPTAGSLTLTVTGSVTRAQLELGTTDTNYQSVVSLYDITESGVQTAYGLYYDGVDDWLVTPTITPGTDKVQVFSGVRKLSDAAAGLVVGTYLSTSTNGSFELNAPRTASSNFGFLIRGDTANAQYSLNNFASPVSSVISAACDISGATIAEEIKPRVNGSIPTLAVASAGPAGGGNFLAYPVYFGRRGGTTLPLNGYAFREVGRFGPNLDAATIANVENWINQNTGAY